MAGLPEIHDTTQKTVLFDGCILDRNWIKYRAAGGDFKKHCQLKDGALVVDVPKDSSWGRAGIMSPAPLVWLDKFGEGAEVRVTFRFAPEQTTGFVVALTPLYGLNGNDPSSPRALLHWRKTGDDSGGKVSMFLSPNEQWDPFWEVDVPGTAPEKVSFILSPNGIRIEAPGAPDDVVPWSELAPAQGFRVYAYSHADKAGEPVKMALQQILLERKAGKPLPPKPVKVVEPLSQTALFNGEPGDLWEPAAIQIENSSDFIHFENNRMTAEIPGKSHWERAGLLSKQPILDLDGRILTTPYKLTVKVDPEQTTGMQMMFYGHKTPNMWKSYLDAAINFTLHTQGKHAGKYVLDVRGGINDYRRWWRTVDAAWVKKNWDGTLIIETGKGWIKASIPGGSSVRGSQLSPDKGAKLYMTIYAHPEKEYAKARLVLEKITGEWVMPQDMSKMERWEYVDDTDFDAKVFLDDLAGEISAVENEQWSVHQSGDER